MAAGQLANWPSGKRGSGRGKQRVITTPPLQAGEVAREARGWGHGDVSEADEE